MMNRILMGCGILFIGALGFKNSRKVDQIVEWKRSHAQEKAELERGQVELRAARNAWEWEKEGVVLRAVLDDRRKQREAQAKGK